MVQPTRDRDERFRGSPDQAGNDVVWWVKRKK